jgi:hypothetical protein
VLHNNLCYHKGGKLLKNKEEQKKVRKPLKELTLLDRFLFDTAMSDSEISRNILSIIFDNRDIPPIHFSAAEPPVSVSY